MSESYSGYRSKWYSPAPRLERDSVSNGYRSLYYGRDPTRGVLTPLDVKQIRKLEGELTRKELADFYDVSVTTIREVQSYERWTNIN